jgi:hypothetical protein
MDLPSRATSAPPGTGCELYFVKAGHYYAFRYEPGAEKSLVYALLDAALDPRLNLDLEDARKLVAALGLASFSTLHG